MENFFREGLNWAKKNCFVNESNENEDNFKESGEIKDYRLKKKTKNIGKKKKAQKLKTWKYTTRI